MAKVQNNLSQINKTSINFGKYCIDSFKLLIDKEHFKAVNIPEDFIEVSADSGEEIRQFKRKSIQIPFKDTTIYVGAFKKILRQRSIEKVVILFSSKVSGDNYFDGITKDCIIEVLKHIKNNGYIDYDSEDVIFQNIYAKDIDIKVDFKFYQADKEKLESYNKELQQRFVHNSENFHKYTDKGKNGIGIQTFNRDRTTNTKPFIKFYDKTKELTTKHIEFFKTLPDDIQSEVLKNFVYRYEYTLKDKEFMAKFGVLNRLQDVLEVTQGKWQKIGKTLLNANFQLRMTRKKDIGKLTPTEKILALMFFELYQKHNVSLIDIKTMFTSSQDEKKPKYRAKLLFEKIYSKISMDNASEVEKLSERYETIRKFDAIFGLA